MVHRSTDRQATSHPSSEWARFPGWPLDLSADFVADFNNGCATARPFRIGRTLEIPITVRRDGTLLFLGYSPAEIGPMWIQNAEDIAAARGIVVLLTHCEKRFSGNRGMLATYRQFLEFVGSSPRFEWSTAGRIAVCAARP